MDLQLPTYLIIILAIVAFCLIWLLLHYIDIRAQYKATFDWWKNAGGTKYNKMFSLFHLLSSFNNRLMYQLTSLLQPPFYDLSLDMIYFTMYDLMPYKAFVDSNGVAQGCLTPRSLCESILPSYGTGDAAYDKWLLANQDKYDENVYLKYDVTTGINPDPNVPDPYADFQYTRKNKGIYPSVNDTTSWKILILDWLNNGGKSKKWTIRLGQIDKLEHFVMLDSAGDSPLSNWYTIYSGDETPPSKPRPDNFLARMSINPNSPLMTYFIGNQYSAGYMVVDAVSFNRLLSSNSDRLGGWIGYMLGKGHNVSANELSNYIRTSSEYDPIPTPPPCDNGNKALGGFLGAFKSFVPAISMIAFIPAPLSLFGAAGAVGLGALGLGAIGGYEGATSACV
jgi:hypothetical protein